MSAMQRRKGQVGECELARELNRLFGTEAHRGRQYHGRDDAPDVAGMPGVHPEVKRCEALRLYPAMDQCVADCGDEEVPVVFHRRNNRDWLAVVRLDDLPALVTKLYLLMAETA